MYSSRSGYRECQSSVPPPRAAVQEPGQYFGVYKHDLLKYQTVVVFVQKFEQQVVQALAEAQQQLREKV